MFDRLLIRGRDDYRVGILLLVRLFGEILDSRATGEAGAGEGRVVGFDGLADGFPALFVADAHRAGSVGVEVDDVAG